MWDAAIDHFGSQVALGKAIGESQSTISYKILRGHPVPAEWVSRIVIASDGVLSRHDLRPDLWPADTAAA